MTTPSLPAACDVVPEIDQTVNAAQPDMSPSSVGSNNALILRLLDNSSTSWKNGNGHPLSENG
ncbi:hypothetical protein [Rhodococcus sp. Leaf278]|uniref:hypothetical protein n=1 Tax=Rhodococcus sp. Leaf278 TaxID=1736319 RepID=UPI0012E3495E|nr:hypothetical protein [Rhodococcus sp. Leaf278]